MSSKTVHHSLLRIAVVFAAVLFVVPCYAQAIYSVKMKLTDANQRDMLWNPCTNRGNMLLNIRHYTARKTSRIGERVILITSQSRLLNDWCKDLFASVMLPACT